MFILTVNIFFLFCLVQVMYFSLLRIGTIEATYWLGSKKKIQLKNNFFISLIFLAAFCIIHGLISLKESHFFWELEFLNFFFLFLLPAFWLSCLGSISTLDLSLKLLPYCFTLPLTLAGIAKGNPLNADFLDTLFLIFIVLFFFTGKMSASNNQKYGLGDVLFLLALSFWMNTFALAMTVFFAASTMIIIFAIFKRQFSWTKKSRIPFGPALSFFAIIVEFCWASYTDLGIV